MNSISLCMIVKNEEAQLRRCLSSIIDMVDEIILVDTGSTDQTIPIAEEFHAKIYHHKWNNDFSEARNVSLKYATKDLILILDADDEFCEEDKAQLTKLKNSTIKKEELYYFQTLNYCGDSPSIQNIAVNPNPRMFTNHAGFHYDGIVHNQLINDDLKINHIFTNIRVYHYGYLTSTMKSKKKRDRNISLLRKQLEKDPEDAFVNYNLGNEYIALNDNETALKYFEKSYQYFVPNLGYSFFLLYRLITLEYVKNHFDEALNYINVGLQYYKDSPDLYFYQGLIYEGLGRITLAIRAFETCLTCGKKDTVAKYLYGAGTFKATYHLASIYYNVKDYDMALKYYNETIHFEPNDIEPVKRIAHILTITNIPIEEVIKILETIFTNINNSDFLIAYMLYQEEHYQEAIQYLDKVPKDQIDDQANLLRLYVLLRSGAYKECIEYQEISKESPEYVKKCLSQITAAVLLNQFEKAEAFLKEARLQNKEEQQKKSIQVYEQFIKMASGKQTTVLSEDVEDVSYTATIFELLETLLCMKQHDLFFKSLELLNLISDHKVLLHLGKLYYQFGFEELGRQELIHSIKEFEIYDYKALMLLHV